MSSALFTILSDVLSRVFAELERSGRITGVKIARDCPHVTHLLYVDDLVVYRKATEKEAAETRQILELYCQSTRQEINWEKSSVHFSQNRPNTRKKSCVLS